MMTGKEKTNDEVLAELGEYLGTDDEMYQQVAVRLNPPEQEPEPLQPSRATGGDTGDYRIGIPDDRQEMLNRQQLADEDALLNAIQDGDDEAVARLAHHNVRRHNLQQY